MISRMATRRTNLDGTPKGEVRERFARTAAGVVVAISVIAAGIMTLGFGGSAAADEAVATKAGESAVPVSLAGRWVGRYYGYGRGKDVQDCGADGCGLTYDIVACKEGWCGIAIKDDKSCGAVAVHLAADAKEGDAAFKGKLELAKGAAPYTVEAWYSADAETKAVQLHLLGDTGPELMLFRRSFPLEATFERAGDATCNIDKATS